MIGAYRAGKAAPYVQADTRIKDLRVTVQTVVARRVVAEAETTRHLLTGLLRQSVFRRLASHEDVNDGDRLVHGHGRSVA